MYVAHEISYIGGDTGAKAIILDSAFLPILEEVRPHLPELRHVIVVGESTYKGALSFQHVMSDASDRLDSYDASYDDIVSIIYTSGTTGRPKGATQTHRSILANVASCCYVNKFTHEDRMLCALPLFNNFAINVVMMCTFYSGAALVVVGRFEAEEVLANMTDKSATYFAGTPTMFVYLLQAYDPARHNLGPLRVVNSGGAHCPGQVIEDVERIFGAIHLDGYGQTEACGFTTLNPIVGVRKKDSVGVPIADIWIKIVDNDFVELQPREVGEIALKGDVFSIHGYWNRPEINAETYREGWFRSGDLGYLDEDGYLYIVDRKQDLIITGGANIYPVEVEQILYTHPAVALAAVIGIPDEVKGELAKAYIVLKEGKSATEGEIIDYVRGKIAKYKAPRMVEFVTSLPQGPTGKILKRELRAQVLKKFL
jgi:long-chain acyl-CoA synthetase